MSRFQGYVGIANYMGARFTSTEQALAPVLKEAAQRGLIYVDDGSSPRSLAGADRQRQQPAVRQSRSRRSTRCRPPPHIDGALARLEAVARERGIAVGVASALPASIERIAQWAKAAESRGFVLVPISAVGDQAEVELTELAQSLDHDSLDGSGTAVLSLSHAHRCTKPSMPRYEDLPYRPCAGLCVINRKGLVFIGRRADGPEHIDETHVWQMPQGGIDEGEKPYPAALRELYEETNIKSVEKLGEITEWLTYDIPKKIGSKAWKGKYRGQKQKWYALRFTGKDSEIDIENPRRRARSGVHRLALGADGKPSRPRGAVQARDLRAGREGVFEIREVTSNQLEQKRGRSTPAFSWPMRRRRNALSASPCLAGAGRAP